MAFTKMLVVEHSIHPYSNMPVDANEKFNIMVYDMYMQGKIDIEQIVYYELHYARLCLDQASAEEWASMVEDFFTQYGRTIVYRIEDANV